MRASEQDLVYLAGFLDGEGTFTVYKNGTVYSALVSAASNDRSVIIWLQETFGGNTYSPQSSGNRAQGYQWQIRDKELLIELLPRLAAYLKIKGTQARLLMKYCMEYQNHPRGKMLTDDDRETRDAYCTLFSSLNAVGRSSSEEKAQVVALFSLGEVSLP